VAKQKPDLPQGTFDMLVLKALSLGPMHGYGVAQRIQQLAILPDQSIAEICLGAECAVDADKGGLRRATGGVEDFGHAASGAVQEGAWNVMTSTHSTTTKVAAGAAMSAASATREVVSSFRAKDELTLGWRLEGQDGRVLVDKSEKRKASSDGEDVLTPLVEHASESIVTAIKAGK